MLFEDTEIDITFFNDDNKKEKNNDILSAKDGFLRGNMFKSEYQPYKKYNYLEIVPKNEKEAMIFNVMQYSFAINDLNLYLDLHPDDEDKFKLFKQLIKENKKAEEVYIKNYEPLLLEENDGSHYDWTCCWPWENVGDGKYV